MSFRIEYESDPPITFQLEEEQPVRVGRAAECEIRLRDGSASRVHCYLRLVQGQVWLADAGSRWGTLVNGEHVQERRLESGDVILIGDTRIYFTSPHEAQTLVPKRLTESPSAPEETSEPGTLEHHVSTDHFNNLATLVGDRFRDYDIESIVARSATGIVFQATDVRQNLKVALKIFWPELFSDESRTARFLRAMRAMVPLTHTHLIKLYAAGRSQRLCFTASEFIEGESSAQQIQRSGVAGMMDWETAWTMLVGLTEAIEYLHEHNLVHRSIHPNNILIRRADKLVMLGDSMLAKALDQLDQSRITQRGEVVGDIYYVSPEQLSESGIIDQRSDLYSLGATLYAVLTGRPPFTGSPGNVVGQILTTPPEPPTTYHLSIPASFEGIILKLLAKRPEDRYQTATQLKSELARVSRYLNVKRQDP